jgi:retron-type reverse transcriptase
MYRLTRQDLLLDLYVAFYDARRHKASMPYVTQFESNLLANIEALCDALLNRTYKARPSQCFIVESPKKREVFSAQFTDRVVHHLYFNYTHRLFEATFIHDSYSCIKGRGTHYGIERLKAHILKESQNYTVPCYALKLDIRGYFMHINRQRLLEIAAGTIRKMATHRVAKDRPETWADVIDIDFTLWLTRELAMLDPKEGCRIVGPKSRWTGLDRNKSLFFAGEGCGLPIGNLTSQLFSNVFLNVFDQYMKRALHCTHYGRYVDDAYVVSCDREWLRSLVPSVRLFLKESLALDLHMGKLAVCDCHRGVEFLGAFVKPYRTYVANRSLRRVRDNIRKAVLSGPEKTASTISSYRGMVSHYAAYNVAKELFASCNALDRQHPFHYLPIETNQHKN